MVTKQSAPLVTVQELADYNKAERRPGWPMDYRAFHGRSSKWPKLKRAEHAVYHQALTERLREQPDYVTIAGRPSEDTAEQVWQLVAPFVRVPEPAPRWGQPTGVRFKQALVVVLNGFLRHAKRRRTVSFARMLEAVAAKWSGNYRALRDETGCQDIQAMPLHTVKSILRDIRCEGIDVRLLWRIAVGAPAYVSKAIPLYRLDRHRPIKTVGYALLPRRGNVVRDFLEIVKADPDYRRPRVRGGHPGLLLASAPMPRRPLRREFLGGRAFNAVDNGGPALERLAALEQQILLFNVEHFRQDYRGYRRELKRRLTAEHDPRVRARLEGMVAQAQGVSRQIRTISPDEIVYGEYVRIRTGYFRAINRRYHARHFGPEWVLAKDDGLLGASPRERWFAFERPTAWDPSENDRLNVDDPDHDWLQHQIYPLRGYDTSSSMTQIMAWILSIDELEPLVFNPDVSFTTHLAELFWNARDQLMLPAAYTTVEHVREMVKKLWTAHAYGGNITNAVWRDDRWRPDGCSPQPPFLDRGTVEERNKARKQQRAYYTQYVQPTAEAIGKLLNGQPWYAPLRMFYRACRSVAKNAMRQDQYAGVQIVDPFDGTTVRWNPVEFGRYRYIGEWGEMTLRLPGRWKTAAKRDPKTGRPQKRNHEDFEHAVAKPTTGDYPVSQRRLQQALPPYIVHMLDAALSGLVLELLEGDGLPYLALHDAWYMAGVGETEHSIFTDELVGSPLWTRVQIALVAWDRSLGPVYDTLIRYLGDDPEFRDWAYEIKARWIERKTAPRFVLSEARKSAPIWPESD